MTLLPNNNATASKQLTKLLIFLIGFIYLCTLLKGIRIPNLWTYTHFLFDYEFGFMRRGFIGAIYGFFSPERFPYASFLYFSSTIVCINIGLMLLLITRLIKSLDRRLIAAMLIYFSSASMVYQAHSIGFAENIGLSACLISFLIRSFYRKLIFITISFTVLLFIHEANMIIYFPIVFMSLIFMMNSENRNHPKLLLALAIYMVMLFFFITTQTLDKPTAALMQASAQQRSSLPLNPVHMELLWHSSDNLLPLLMKHWSNPGRIYMFIGSALLIFPLCFILLRFSFALLKQQPAYIKWMSFLASISPLLLHFVAWDTIRWNALVLTCSFLMLINIKLHCQGKIYADLKWNKSLTLAAVILLIQLPMPVLLFDGYQSKHFPFIAHWEFLQQVFSGAQAWPPTPKL
ncbi:MAG: hypothetical protein HRU20_31375 [Pseudomonadales bacterium]|nr:hypothetical protein [Pseudomonadales bacterium]